MTRLRATFASVKNRNFRLFITGQAISSTGTWIQKIGQAWLVLRLTDSGTLLGVTAALQQLPILLIGPWGGLLADRLNKRRLVLATQTVSGLLAVALGLLTATGNISLWMVLVLAFLLGTTDALDKPGRQTIVSEMVDARHLTNAVLLNSVVMNSARIVGPAIAGIMIATIGLAASFYVNGASFLAVVVALLAMNTSELHPPVPVRRQRGQLREGMRYVRATPALAGPLMLMAVAGLFAYEWTVTLPLLAREAFGGGADTFGAMFAAMGVGAVLGGLGVAGSMRAGVHTIVKTAYVFSALILLLAVTPTLTTALIALVALGAVSIVLRSLTNAHLQLSSDPDKRGRVLSLLTVAVAGTTPIGAPLVGWIADDFGVRFALGLGGIATVAAALATAAFVRRTTPNPEPSFADDVANTVGETR